MELALSRNNLYSAGFVVQLNEDEGLLLRDKLEIKGGVDDEYYTVTKDDMLDLIAWKKYKDEVDDPSKYWWIIADANNIINPLDLSEFFGKEILIPNITNVLLNLD